MRPTCDHGTKCVGSHLKSGRVCWVYYVTFLPTPLIRFTATDFLKTFARCHSPFLSTQHKHTCNLSRGHSVPCLADQINSCLLPTLLIGSLPTSSLLVSCFIALQINYPCPTVRTWVMQGERAGGRRAVGKCSISGLILILICAWDLARGVSPGLGVWKGASY
jgi:hypothetical protein